MAQLPPLGLLSLYLFELGTYLLARVPSFMLCYVEMGGIGPNVLMLGSCTQSSNHLQKICAPTLLSTRFVQARLAALQERTAVNESRLLSKLYPPGKQNQTRQNMSQQGQEVQGMDGRTSQIEQQTARYGEQHMEHPWCLDAKDNDATMRVCSLSTNAMPGR